MPGKRGKEYTQEAVAEVLRLRAEGNTYRQIQARTGVGKSTVQRICASRCAAYPPPEKRARGRRQLLAERDKRHLLLIARRNRFDGFSGITEIFNSGAARCVSRQTVARALKQVGMRSYTAKKKPLLSKINKLGRYRWAISKLGWSVEKWKQVLWSDESCITRLGQGRKLVVCRQGERCVPGNIVAAAQGGGGKILIWGAICGNGKLPLVRIIGTLRQEHYREILKSNLRTASRTLFHGRKGCFMQDNAPCHKSRMMQHFFNSRAFAGRFRLLAWPPCSPDLNPIENCWSLLKRRIWSRCPRTVEELWRFSQEEWDKITQKTINAPIESMPRRIRAVVAVRGGHTKY